MSAIANSSVHQASSTARGGDTRAHEQPLGVVAGAAPASVTGVPASAPMVAATWGHRRAQTPAVLVAGQAAGATSASRSWGAK